MTTSHRLTAVLVALVALVALAIADNSPSRAPAGASGSGSGSSSVAMPDAQATLDDIRQTLGFVPTFLKDMPPQLLPGAWMQLKTLQMSDSTALPPKTKELIGLAVASQIPCQYCISFHTSAARAHGATDQEVREAVAMAALTREMSTMINGLQIDPQQFRRDTERMMHAGQGQTSSRK